MQCPSSVSAAVLRSGGVAFGFSWAVEGPTLCQKHSGRGDLRCHPVGKFAVAAAAAIVSEPYPTNAAIAVTASSVPAAVTTANAAATESAPTGAD